MGPPRQVKIDGKTINRRLNAEQAQLYRQWIDNDRRLRDVIDKMRSVAAQATDLILEDESPEGRAAKT